MSYNYQIDFSSWASSAINLPFPPRAITETSMVAGFDDVKYASLLSVPLTTYHQPCADIGRSAVQVMQHRLTHPDAAPQRITLQGRLITRRSTE